MLPSYYVVIVLCESDIEVLSSFPFAVLLCGKTRTAFEII